MACGFCFPKKTPAQGGRKVCYFAEPMRQIVVPQSGHLPLVMGLPFFVVPTFLAKFLSQQM